MRGALFSLQGKVVCVVGGTGLIGRAVAQALCREGARVWIGARRKPERAMLLASRGKNMMFFPVDIGDERSINHFVREVTDRSGRIDSWINCAYPHPEYRDIDLKNIEADDMLNDLHVHLLGYFRCCRAALNVMKRQWSGSIVNFGSIYGELVPDFRMYQNTEIKKIPTYFIIKSGIHMLTKYFAALGADYKVRVNTIAPGGVFDRHSRAFVRRYSARVPLRRMAKPHEMAGPSIFLASEASSYMTGQTLFVDGGLTIW